ncbi:MAG: MerR family transcriptional regulator [Solirubrobacteraceae bacterium]
MSRIRTNAAAAMLGVSPNTLRSWEQRFGHPAPRRTDGGHRMFELTDIEALRGALAETGDIASAVAIVRARGEGPSTAERLRFALGGYDEGAADRLLEESLAFRSVERTVQELLLAAVQLLAEGSPERSFATRYAAGWLAAAKRVAPQASETEGVMIFDASAPEQLDALHAQALELLLRRTGLRTLCLPSTLAEERVGSAIRALQPSALVLAGSGAPLHALGRLVHATRVICAGVEIFDFRGALPHTGASTFSSLGDLPIAAVQQLRSQLLESSRSAHAAAIV